MKEQSNLKINEIMILAAGVVLSLDLITKLTGLPFPFLSIVKWLTTVFYPIVAGYVFLFAFTFTEADVAWIKNPRNRNKMLFAIKYLLFATGILLLPSCLSFWFEFPPVLLRTLKTALVVVFPLAVVLLIFIVWNGVKSAVDSWPEAMLSVHPWRDRFA